MPPLRRYLRLTPSSVLELRIYVDNPADTSRWLLNERAPMLGRVLEAVRPLVGVKLREEGRMGKGNGKKAKGKRKGVRDVVVTDDFEVSIFLTELSTRHSILVKRKVFKSEKPRLGRVGGKMTGGEEGVVGDRGDGDGDSAEGVREVVMSREGEEEERRLADIPDAGAGDDDVDGRDEAGSGMGARKRRRRDSLDGEDAAEEGWGEDEEEGEEGLFLSDDDDAVGEAGFQTHIPPPPRRQQLPAPEHEGDGGDEEKKKLGFSTTYDGYAIYGRIVCLIVKRKGGGRGKEASGKGGGAVMEEWVRSTQVGGGDEEPGEGNGE